MQHLTVSDVARLAHGAMTPRAVSLACDRGELPHTRTPKGVRLIERDAAEHWIERRGQQPELATAR